MRRMTTRISPEAWESVTNHDDVNMTTISMLPILMIFAVQFAFWAWELWGDDEDDDRDPPWAILVCFLLVCFFVGNLSLRLGGPIKLLEQLAPPQQVVARRRTPQVYRKLLRWTCCCRSKRKSMHEVRSSDTLRPRAESAVPALNVLIMITGTHGDVAPFVALAHELRKRYGHRIRFATHLTHREYVLKEGLDFYPLAGDPRVLSQWMVQSEGRLLPDIHAPLTKLREEVSEMIPAKLAMINDIMESTWPACVGELPEEMAAKRPRFVPHAIISNPVTYGHIHCASALNIPLHMAFPQPWTPTAAYPHPFVMGTGMPNRITFSAFDKLTTMGLNVNKWRTEALNLPPIAGDRGAHVLNDLRVPFSYMWSPALSAKPMDWGDHVDVLGNFVHDAVAASGYEPSAELAEFLERGAAPIFVGFGSMVIDDPDSLFEMLVEAAARANARMIVQSSWSRLGGGGAPVPGDVHLIGGCPHSWLLPRCSAVVHHGGAGTVAAGLRFGLPTFVVPFFGDQHFWGDTVLRAGAGPPPCPYRELCADRLVDAIARLRAPEVRRCAAEIAEAMSREDGIGAMCDSFTRSLPLYDMVCSASLFARSEPRVVVAEKWHPGASLKLSQEAHAALQESPLRTALCCDYGYIHWDTHAPAFVGHNLFALVSLVAQGIFRVLSALFLPCLEVAHFVRDLREKGGRDGVVNVAGSIVLIFCIGCMSAPSLVLRRLLECVVQFYLGAVEYLLRQSRLWRRKLVHVRARHQCVRPGVSASTVPCERRDDLIQAATIAEHVLGVVALVQHRGRGRLSSRLSRKELLYVLCILSRCARPEHYSNCCVRAARRLKARLAYVRILCARVSPDETVYLKGWCVDESISTLDFCLRYGASICSAEGVDAV